MIQSLLCFRNNEKRISSFEPTTAQLYQKQYYLFRCITSIKMQTIVIYSIVTVINDQYLDKSASLKSYFYISSIKSGFIVAHQIVTSKVLNGITINDK